MKRIDDDRKILLMNLSLLDRSNYYKGLLVLSRRDRIVDTREKNLLLEIGEILGFDRRFCEATINELLVNPHLTREPVVFSDQHLKECFFHDALRLALVDGCLHPIELRWLRSVAHANNQSDQWLDAIIRESKENAETRDSSAAFEIQQYLQGAI
jgi:DnaJ-domain-containing protein 1